MRKGRRGASMERLVRAPSRCRCVCFCEVGLWDALAEGWARDAYEEAFEARSRCRCVCSCEAGLWDALAEG